MKNKHFIFSLSLGIAILILVLLSIFLQNEVFENISRVITIPFLIFTVSIFFININEDIISICENKIEVEKEKSKLWEYYKTRMEKDLSNLEPVDSPETDVERETNDIIEMVKNKVNDAEKELATYNLNIVIFSKIQQSLQTNLFNQIFYLIACSILFLSMCISPILAPYCKFIPYTTLTLLSLFLAVFELLIKKLLAQKILNKKYEKIYRQIALDKIHDKNIQELNNGK